MKWKPTRRSENIRDARTGGSTRSRSGGGRAAGGAAGGVGALGIVGLLLYACTGDPSLIGLDNNPGLGSGGSAYSVPAEVDDTTFDTTEEQFMNAIVIDLEAFWAETFTEFGLQYDDATFTFYDTPTPTACGGATAAIGPHYCPLDSGIYIELGFFDQLAAQFGAQGDTAQAYVVAHEFAHHVQNELGISEAVRNAQARDRGNRNAYSIALELQADCLAGVWMGSFADRVTDFALERGDLEEALTAAAAVGDDRIQEATTGRIDKHTWTHGSADQRQNWLLRGFDSVDTEQCDTFEG